MRLRSAFVRFRSFFLASGKLNRNLKKINACAGVLPRCSPNTSPGPSDDMWMRSPGTSSPAFKMAGYPGGFGGYQPSAPSYGSQVPPQQGNLPQELTLCSYEYCNSVLLKSRLRNVQKAFLFWSSLILKILIMKCRSTFFCLCLIDFVDIFGFWDGFLCVMCVSILFILLLFSYYGAVDVLLSSFHSQHCT